MIDFKHILASRTVWANIIGLLALGASVFGISLDAVETGRLVDACLQGVAAVSFIASTVFRVLATRRIGA
jgi:hypothetical protein